MMLRGLNKDVVRWLLMAALALMTLIARTMKYGFFHGKDWILYLLLAISIWFALYYRGKNRIS